MLINKNFFNVLCVHETGHWAQMSFLFGWGFFSVWKQTKLQVCCRQLNYIFYSPCSSSGFFFFFLSPQSHLPFFLYFFLFFFLPNNFFVEWARLGERPGDEKMGPVRNPGQWGNLPEPPGGTVAGKCWGQIPFQHWYLNFHCCFHPEFPRTSQTTSYELLVQKVTCYPLVEKEASRTDWTWHNQGVVTVVVSRSPVFQYPMLTIRRVAIQLDRD